MPGRCRSPWSGAAESGASIRGKGVQELVTRRIGQNELDTIQVLEAIVDAQDEYARTEGRKGAFQAYARRLFSTPGKHDGLYWASAEGEPESPLGPLAAAAAATGVVRSAGDKPTPYHGYVFRLLERQGPNAPGGALDYVVNGLMIGGFGVIAVPAQWGVTGIQTFMVSHSGVVYQRNLGPETARIAPGSRRSTLGRSGSVWRLRSRAPSLGRQACGRMKRSARLRRQFFVACWFELKIVWPVLTGLFIAQLALGMLVGALENWSLIASVYFGLITGLTIGYGDVVPVRVITRLIAIVIGFIGVLTTGLIAAVGVRALQDATDETGR